MKAAARSELSTRNSWYSTAKDVSSSLESPALSAWAAPDSMTTWTSESKCSEINHLLVLGKPLLRSPQKLSPINSTFCPSNRVRLLPTSAPLNMIFISQRSLVL